MSVIDHATQGFINSIKEAIEKEINIAQDKIIEEAKEELEKALRLEMSKCAGILLEHTMDYERVGTDLRIIIHDRFKK